MDTWILYSDKPLTLTGLLGAWNALGVKPEAKTGHPGPGSLKSALARAEAYEGTVPAAFWEREVSALAELSCYEEFWKKLRLAPLVVPRGLPAEWLPLLEGFAIAEWRQTAEPLSPLALAWLRELGIALGELPAGKVEKTGTADGTALIQVSKNSNPPILRECREHTEEHIDEGMYLLQANLDDVSPEWVAYAMERLFDAGANDVTVLPMTMKKSRPGMLLQVLAYESQLDAMKAIMFRETSTFGLRYFPVAVHRLARRLITVETNWGKVVAKIGYHRGERVQVAPEYEECARLAREWRIPLKQVYQQALEKAKQVSPDRLESFGGG
ncbi:nickel insertion protein [Brevibacillus massiliensis]|uniref:nickel insertion protein n=1 Tax=Brevibacillus massiliensis TaxID=1118054 RepID=UPI0002E82D08|nr:nickel insertion protein [Brevibacillus massiliensis]